MKAEKALETWLPELKPGPEGGTFRVQYPLGAVRTYVHSCRSLFLNHVIRKGDSAPGTAVQAQIY